MILNTLLKTTTTTYSQNTTTNILGMFHNMAAMGEVGGQTELAGNPALVSYHLCNFRYMYLIRSFLRSE